MTKNELDRAAEAALERARAALAIGHFNRARALALESADLFGAVDRPRDRAAALALAREAR